MGAGGSRGWVGGLVGGGVGKGVCGVVRHGWITAVKVRQARGAGLALQEIKRAGDHLRPRLLVGQLVAQ